MGGEGLLLEIFNKFVNELKEKKCKRQEDKMDQHDVWSSEGKPEGQHKKQKRDPQSDSHRDGDYEDHWQFGKDGEVQ
ncbi:hypothetical protein T459_34561 [Capsicum annuum]|uniref:Uncharacterized protein n=1 Tax=Capsicum annuum TaxID=4072 RepID=A0A2G2XVR2_CAPAN|nr:hypothetical protein T459_34561 [Capsicum annuum]